MSKEKQEALLRELGAMIAIDAALEAPVGLGEFLAALDEALGHEPSPGEDPIGWGADELPSQKEVA